MVALLLTHSDMAYLAVMVVNVGFLRPYKSHAGVGFHGSIQIPHLPLQEAHAGVAKDLC